MSGDLGATTPEVHEAARAVLAFWFNELSEEEHWAKDPALDRRIADRFGGLRERLLAGGAAGWAATPETVLAGVIVLDQFSRNIHRDAAGAFAGDALARALAVPAIDRGWDGRLPPERAVFLYMPLMHAEDAALQARSVACFAALGLAEQLRYAEEHRDVIARYGRFPSRNAALGRCSTPEEEAYLSRPDAGW